MGHTSQADLLKKQESALRRIKIGQLYYHYKNPKKLYVVEFVGLLEETEEPCVAYRSLYGQGLLWIRSVKDFLSKIEINKRIVSRFSLVKNS